MDIESIANSWLAEPPWIKVFKHTFDVLEDYVSYTLVSVGAISLSVRLLTTLGTGDLMCILIGVEYGNISVKDLGPYASGGTLGILSYAQTEKACIHQVFSPFMEYLPYILLLETLFLIVVEKFTFKIPRIAQKVERFYANIVEHALFGHDPDVAEDMTDPKTSTEAISRRRQRNEICVSLKRSSIIHHVYLGKNFMKVWVVAFYLAINISYTIVGIVDKAKCAVDVSPFPGVVAKAGRMHFQCRGKKMDFFILALWTQTFLLFLHMIMSLGAMIWCWQFRSVSNLLRTIERSRKEWEPSLVSKHDGEDFLFLFDLLAHSSGIESTLRVLTHSDETFYEICRPNMDPSKHIQLEEDKVKIMWKPADIERWLMSGTKHTRTQKSIDIDSYEVTIFPAETVNNTQNVSARGTRRKPTYSVWFFDLVGGRTELSSAKSRKITVDPNLADYDMSNQRRIENLSFKLTEYTILGLDPGDKYSVELGTKTGNVATRQTITDFVITRPTPVTGLMVYEVKNDSCVVQWLPLEGHPCLKGYMVQVKTHDGKEFKNVAVPKLAKSFHVMGMAASSDYDVSVTALCVYKTKKTQGDPSTVTLTTMAETVKNVRMETATPNSIVVKWDPPLGAMNPQTSKYKLKIFSEALEFSFNAELAGDKMQYNFSKLPDPAGSGHTYTVEIITSILTPREHEVASDPSVSTFSTIPHKPTNFKIGSRHHEILFTKSITPNVSGYKIKWRTSEEGSKIEESVIPPGEEDEQHFKLQSLEEGMVYKVNIFALVTLKDEHVLESKELHSKVEINSNQELVIHTEDQPPQV
ncbi:hypothetical protein TCAL_00641 [Tigriopus californicus]|uniref:Fibronectin type-III domain-containing protein n=1 Tax=Tigriopus californicus TaxID=6832 RepID=A0A553PBZ6_TIGCA|nr:hypothetical protein TCAL_00641 [Tigriopus californicus]